MLEDIRMCSKCGLCNNQRPLLDSERTCQVFWVGLSAKKITSEEETPLSEQTNTGKLIQKIEGKVSSAYGTTEIALSQQKRNG